MIPFNLNFLVLIPLPITIVTQIYEVIYGKIKVYKKIIYYVNNISIGNI